MKSNLPLIGSVLFLAVGLTLVFSYCHGSAGLNAAYPVSGCSLKIDITSTGLPALGGFALTVIGLLLLVAAFGAAIVELVQRPATPRLDKPPVGPEGHH